ncbi:MAG: cupin domain-containing protein [Candidatus Latescibacterota bacterium]|nr:cupin domain-containing protein [Candidatus Latescibacterota bacterium]
MTHIRLAGNREFDLSGPGPVFPDLSFRSSWQAFEQIYLRVGQRFESGSTQQLEEGYLLLDGSVSVEMPELVVEPQGPCALLCGVDSAHRIVAQTDALLLRIAVGVSKPSPPRFGVQDFDREALDWQASIHGGGGCIATRHLWRPEDFVSSWTFVDHAILQTGSSVGYHYHDHLEESFIVLRGHGYMTLDDATFEVEPGSVTFQREGAHHGIYNPFEEEFDFIRVAVAAPDQQFATVDLDEDMRSRSPSDGDPFGT